MVFIEDKHNFLRSIADRPKQKALYVLVSDETFVEQPKEVSEIDAIYYSSIQAIKKNTKAEFNTQYAKISKRKVSEKSAAPFVHDDFLIFTLVIGVLKFDCEKDWLLGVIRNRAKGKTTTTFENLLTGNYQSKANNHSMVLAFLFLMYKSKITNDQLNEAYNSMSDTKESINNDFIRIVHYRAFDIIIQFKLPRDIEEISRLLEFESRFKKRINVFTYIAYNSILLLLLIGAYEILHSLPEDIKSRINEIGIIIGIGGVGLFGNIIPMWRTKFQELILRAFGYRNN
jgi:hypothetical protein